MTTSAPTEQDVISLLNLQTQLHAAVKLNEHKEAEVTRLRAALVGVRDYYGKHVGEHMPDDGTDAQSQPECFCPFCISTRALQG